MYFQYGNFQHSDNDVQVTTASRVSYSRGKPDRVTKSIVLTGELIASGQAANRTAINNLISAYSVDGLDAGLYHDDGSLSPHYLDSSASLSGVRVVNVAFPKGDGSEYATCRTYSITLEAVFIAGSHDGVVAFTETLRFTGTGGPRRIWQETLRGPPVRQIGSQRTVARATQSGSAIGLYGPLASPSPLWPTWEVPQRRQRSTGSPTLEGQRFVNYPSSWVYEFESPAPLFGTPHRK